MPGEEHGDTTVKRMTERRERKVDGGRNKREAKRRKEKKE